jgi:hypothetical protein
MISLQANGWNAASDSREGMHPRESLEQSVQTVNARVALENPAKTHIA